MSFTHGRWRSSRRTPAYTDTHCCDTRRSSQYTRTAADTAFPENLSALHVTHQLQTLRQSCFIFIIRPHRSSTYVDAAYSYRSSSVVCLSVCHTSEPCKIGCTDRAAVWVEDLDLGGPGNHVLDGGPVPPHGKGQIFGGEWASHCKV